MTTEKKPLTAERFIAKVRKMSATYGSRKEIHVHQAGIAFERREKERKWALLGEVPGAERDAAIAMAKALGLQIDIAADEPSPSDDIHPEPSLPPWTNDAPKGAPPMVVIEYPEQERRAGKGARTNG
jgi:hypothetical protein